MEKWLKTNFPVKVMLLVVVILRAYSHALNHNLRNEMFVFGVSFNRDFSERKVYFFGFLSFEIKSFFIDKTNISHVAENEFVLMWHRFDERKRKSRVVKLVLIH